MLWVMHVRSALPVLFATLALAALDGCKPKPPKDEFGFGGAPKKKENLDRFDESVAKVRDIMPNEEKGTAVVLRLLNESVGNPVSVVYVDESAPEYKEKLDGRLIIAKAQDGKTKEIFSNVAIFSKRWEPGTYECMGAEGDVAIGVQMSPTWNAEAPDTYWTMNPGGACQLKVTEGPKLGDWELQFEAKIVKNDGSGSLLITGGYAYVKRF